MEAIRETTRWASARTPNHTYLVDGTNLVAYIKQGETVPTWFTKPMRNFDRRRRTFVRADVALFGKPTQKSQLIRVQGSKGSEYFVDPEKNSCTCPGFVFRGKCRHLEQALA